MGFVVICFSNWILLSFVSALLRHLRFLLLLFFGFAKLVIFLFINLVCLILRPNHSKKHFSVIVDQMSWFQKVCFNLSLVSKHVKSNFNVVELLWSHFSGFVDFLWHWNLIESIDEFHKFQSIVPILRYVLDWCILWFYKMGVTPFCKGFNLLCKWKKKNEH